jgi:hypothetical protein
MDRLTLLENEIANVLNDIDGTLQSTGYTYYTVTGQIDIDDDVLATSKNILSTDINHSLLTPAEEENQEWGLAQSIYTNEVIYTIESQIKLSGDEEKTKRAAKTACNRVASDLKFAFGKFHNLNKKCNWIKYNGSVPAYTTDGGLINGAKLITTIELNYSQSLNNPDIIAC